MTEHDHLPPVKKRWAASAFPARPWSTFAMTSTPDRPKGATTSPT
ncbi:hypothetical protein [Pseudokineococcus marinus]|nr:hypothetical protein [Pseudokineococcus marinus]